MGTSRKWQLDLDAAKRYEAIPVPTILGPAAQVLVDQADIRIDSNVIDVGCGTGAATRHIAQIVGPEGSVTGIDVNTGMIEVAKSLPQDAGIPIDWRECSAFDLPFGEHSFNIAVSAQTIQFLDDRIKALSEMSRVLEPNGQVVISMWCAVHQNPYFKALIDAVTKYLGADTASGLGAAFTLTSQHEIESLLEQAGLKDPTVEAFEIDLNLPEIDQFAARHISATPMNGNFSASSESLQQDLVMEVAEKLEEYQTEAGVKVPFRIHVGKAQRG